MKKSVYLVILIGSFLISFVLASPVNAVGALPDNCLNLTNVNPQHDPICAPISEGDPHNVCDGTCISYCPTYGGNWAQIQLQQDFKNLSIRIPTNVGFKGNGVRVILKDSNGNVLIDKTVVKNASKKYETLVDASGRTFHKGDVVYLKIIDFDQEAGNRFNSGMLGFRAPDKNSTFLCGENNIACSGCNSCPPPTSRCSSSTCTTPFGQDDYSFLLEGLNDSKIINKMCFADTPVGNADFDFNDMGAVLFGDMLNNAPECESLDSDVLVGKDGKQRRYVFTCKVNSTKCKLSIDNKVIAEKDANNGECTFSHEFINSGDYNITCYAVTDNNEEQTSNACKVKVHIPTDSSGDLLIPVGITLGLVAMLAKPFYAIYKKYS